MYDRHVLRVFYTFVFVLRQLLLSTTIAAAEVAARGASI